MSSINLKSYYLDNANQNRLRNYVMTELSKKYNIQPVIGQLDQRFNRITNVISENVKPEPRLNFQQNLERINKITIEQLLNGFSQILTPYEKPPAIEDKDDSKNDDNSDVSDLYTKLMNEREYRSNPPSTLSTPIQEIVNSQTPQFNLPTIPEEPIIPRQRNNGFQERIELLKQNRSTLMEQRNQVDLETRDQNYRQNVLGEMKSTVNYNTDLENNQALYNDNYNVQNVGKELVSNKEIMEHRFAEYKDKKSMSYKKIDRQFFICSKDRQWFGEVNNNSSIQPALEPYRYRLQLNNNKDIGIYLQNRQRNISSIRIVAVYISITDITSAMPPYIFVYIPELENRLETSLINRKYVFCILTKDDVIGNQIKYINFLTNNNYDPTPLSELNNMTFEILNPLGFLYNDSKDDLLIYSLGFDNIDNPKNLVITTNKVYYSKKYIPKDVLIIKNFGFTDGSNSALKNYLNKPDGHTITTPKTMIESNDYLSEIYIEMPIIVMDNGTILLDPMIIEFQSYLKTHTNPTTNVYGALMNLLLQPSIIMEITKLEPDSEKINQSQVTII